MFILLAIPGSKIFDSSFKPTRSIVLFGFSLRGNLLGKNFDCKLSVFFDLVIQADHETTRETLAEEKFDDSLVLFALYNFAKLNKSLSTQVSILY